MTGSFEKSGNTRWAQCPDCGAWFPVADALLRMKTVELVCPECGREFLPEQARSLPGKD